MSLVLSLITQQLLFKAAEPSCKQKPTKAASTRLRMLRENGLKILYLLVLAVLAGLIIPTDIYVLTTCDNCSLNCDLFKDESKRIILGQWLQHNWQSLTSSNINTTFRECILEKRDSRFGGTILNQIARSYEAFSIELIKNILSYLKKEDREMYIIFSDNDEDIPLHSAISGMAGREYVSLFAEAFPKYTKICLKSKNEKDQAPLDLAFELGHFAATEVLLELSMTHGVSSRQTGLNIFSSTTLLHKAFKRGHVEYFSILLKTCTKLEVDILPVLVVPDENGNTPWQYLINRNHHELEQVLSLCKKYDIDINKLYLDPQRKSTMLHAAIRKKDLKAAAILRKWGATEQPDSRGVKPSERNHCLNCNGSASSTEEKHAITDTQELYIILEDIGNWEALCVNLGVREGFINELRYSKLEVSVLKLRCIETYVKAGTATWEDVIWAVKLYPIQSTKTAKKIEEKYLQQ